jgi:hypothetical protein
MYIGCQDILQKTKKYISLLIDLLGNEYLTAILQDLVI